MKMKIINSGFLITLVISLISGSGFGSIFFPFGFDNGDQLFKEATVFLDTSRQFLFHNKLYNKIIVQNQTLIYFNKGEERDYSININGTDRSYKRYTFFRESNESSHLEMADNILYQQTLTPESYKSRWMFLITIVSQSDDMTCDERQVCEARTLYQILYTTDGGRSFVVFIHDDAYFNLNNFEINRGNGRSNNIPYLLTDYRIVFNVNEKCSINLNQNNGNLTVRPESVLYYGQQDVIFEGLCFDDGTKEIGVLINGTAIKCSVEFEFQIKCQTPYFDQLGEFQVSVVYKNFYYLATMNSRDVQTESEYYLFLDNFNYLVGFIRLPINSSLGIAETAVLRGIQQNIYHNTTDDTYKLKNYQVYKHLSVFNGFVEYFPINFIEKNDPVPDAVRILINYDQLSFEIFLSKKYVNKQTMCSFWKSLPKNKQYYGNNYNYNYYGYISCPNFVNQSTSLTNMIPDEDCNPSKPKLCQILKPGVSQCFISMPFFFPISYYKCCYGDDGAFRPDESYSQLYEKFGKFDHFWQHIRPYLYCCLFTDDCTDVKKRLGI